MKITKKKQKKFLKEKLSSDKRWALRALIKIYQNQTEDEKRAGRTKYHNEVGFSGVDSEFLSSVASQLLENKSVSKKQMKYIFKLIPKYWKQILEISEEKQLNKQIKSYYEN